MTGKYKSGISAKAAFDSAFKDVYAASIPGRFPALLSALIVVGSLGTAAADAAGPMPITGITVDKSNQLVIQFADSKGEFPSPPHVLELASPNHRVVLDFQDALLDKAKLPTPEILTATIYRKLPAIRGISFRQLPNVAKPTARIVLEISESSRVKPRVVNLDESKVTIDLGSAGSAGSAGSVGSGVENTALQESTPPATVASAASSSSAAGAPVPEPANDSVPQAQSSDMTAAAPQEHAAANATNNGAWDWTGSEGTKAGTETTSAAAAPKAVSALDSQAETVPVSNQVTQMSQTTAQQDGEAMAAKSNADVQSQSASEVASTSTVVAQPQPVPAKEAPGATELKPAIADTQSANGATPDLPKTADDMIAKPQPAAEETPEPKAAANAGESELPPGTLPPAASQTAAPAAVPALQSDSPPPTNAETKTARSATAATEALKLFNNGVRSHLHGKLSDAILDYKGAIAANPGLADAHSNLGLVYNQQHNYAEAIVEFRKALAINPKDAITYNGIGAALRAQRDLPGAIKNWQTAVDLDPALAAAHYNLGTAYAFQKDFDRALESYENAVKNDAHMGDAFYRMGLILEKKNELVDAADKFQAALKLSSTADYSDDAKKQLALINEKKAARK